MKRNLTLHVGQTRAVLTRILATCMFLIGLTAFSQKEDHTRLRKDALNEYRSKHYAQAEGLLEAAIGAAQKANNQFEVALALSALGDVYQEELRFGEAEQLYRKSISILLPQPTQSHALAIVWRNLASVLIAKTEYEEALAAFKHASKLMKATKLVDPQLDAQILNGRGVIYFYRRQFGRAKTSFERAREVPLVPGETRDLSTEDVLNNLAHTYQATGQYAKAEKTYRQALNLAEMRLGPFHPNLPALLTNLGSLYIDLGRYKDAEANFQQAVVILEKSTTPVDENRLMEALHGLAKTYIRENEESQAEPVLRRASEIARRSLNQPFLIPEILNVLDDYSKVLRDLSNPVDADRVHAEAQRIRVWKAFTVEAKPKLKR